SWKIIEIRLPRSSRIAAGLSFRRSTPSNRISPPSMRPGGFGIRLMIDSAVTLLPHPDSPTRPSVRPASSVKLTPSTAADDTPSDVNVVRRPRTSSSGSVIATLGEVERDEQGHALTSPLRGGQVKGREREQEHAQPRRRREFGRAQRNAEPQPEQA